MARIAFISDVHGDLHALRDALVQIERLGCDRVVCAGDLVDYGLFPQETIELLMAHQIPCIRGNHDRWAAGAGVHEACCGRASAAGEGGQRTGPSSNPWELSAEALAWLSALRPSLALSVEGVRVAVWHGSPRGDMDGVYPGQVTGDDLRRLLDRAAADVLVVGHTHLPFRLPATGGGVVVNPGALLRDPGTPIEVPAGGTFGVLELPSRTFTVHRAADGDEVEIARSTTRW